MPALASADREHRMRNHGNTYKFFYFLLGIFLLFGNCTLVVPINSTFFEVGFFYGIHFFTCANSQSGLN